MEGEDNEEGKGKERRNWKKRRREGTGCFLSATPDDDTFYTLVTMWREQLYSQAQQMGICSCTFIYTVSW